MGERKQKTNDPRQEKRGWPWVVDESSYPVEKRQQSQYRRCVESERELLGRQDTSAAKHDSYKKLQDIVAASETAKRSAAAERVSAARLASRGAAESPAESAARAGGLALHAVYSGAPGQIELATAV